MNPLKTTTRPVRPSQAIRPASLSDAARPTRRAIALCDVSASMTERDAPGGQRRIDALNEILRLLQAENPTLRLIAFSDAARYAALPLPHPGGSTALHDALDFAAPIASGAAVALISDGEPDDEAAALAAARRFPAAVNVFYCGPEGGPGQDFLRRLAQATGGQYQPVSLAPAQALPALRRVLSLPVPK